MVRNFLLILATVFVFNGTASGATMESLYSGIRPLGMGNAFTAVANDENAAFYNPAGLNSVKDGRIVLPIPPTFLVEVSQNTLDMVNDISNIDNSNISGTVDTLKKYVGKDQYARLAYFPNYTKRNFEIGFLANATFNMSVHQPSYPYIDANIKADTGLIAALARGYKLKNKNKLQLGTTLKIIQRRGVNKRYTAVDLADANYDFANDLKSKTGLGLNLGAIYTLEKHRFKPSFGISIRNLGDMGFGEAGLLKQSVNLGVALHSKLGPIPATFAFDWWDLTGNVGSDSDIPKRLHLGAEFKLHRMLEIRTGLNQGYISYGLEANLWIFKISYVNYSEEVGAYAGQEEDKRQVLLFQAGW
ncbi:MAG: hypothetical protein IEMM0002_0498 [bacterium]|nr:MAG: hypothetical protein IEMM0002_0498 [bacterium]